MLNRTELLRLAEKLASTLIEYKTEKSETDRGKKVTEQEVKNILESRNIKYFIDNLTDLMQKNNSSKNMFKEIVEEVLKMPHDNFPLFVTLIKFEYNYQK
jgi:tRNA(Ile)-lysidine synthase TilS/MesJ